MGSVRYRDRLNLATQGPRQFMQKEYGGRSLHGPRDSGKPLAMPNNHQSAVTLPALILTLPGLLAGLTAAT